MTRRARACLTQPRTHGARRAGAAAGGGGAGMSEAAGSAREERVYSSLATHGTQSYSRQGAGSGQWCDCQQCLLRAGGASQERRCA